MLRKQKRELTILIFIPTILDHPNRSSFVQSTLDLQKKAFSRVGVKIWNMIPNELKTFSKDSFNNK